MVIKTPPSFWGCFCVYKMAAVEVILEDFKLKVQEKHKCSGIK